MFPLHVTMGKLWILGHLLYLSAEGIQEQQISLLVILELGGTGIVYTIMTGHVPQLLPGIMLLWTGFASREQIGYGDGWLILALGMWLGTVELLWMLLLGMGFGTICACCFRRRELPLVPFLTVAYVIVWCLFQS